MIKTLLAQVKEYRNVSLITPVFTALEVVMEVLIPFVTASIIDKGIEAGDIGQIYFYGGIMLVIAFLSLFFGVMAGRYGFQGVFRLCRQFTGRDVRKHPEIFLFQH